VTGQLWWYVARSGGIVAWSLLAASVVWGLVLSGKPFGRRPRPAWVLDLHRYLGGLGLVFTGVHVSALVLDDHVHVGLVQLLVPFTSSYRPSAVAWGVVSLYLLLAVELTSLLRGRLPRRLWRRVHAASFALFVASTVHGLTAGTDGGNGALRVAMVATGAAVAALTTLRVIQVLEPPPPAPEARRISRPAPVRIRG
jgi:hypothetical protein